MLSCTKSYSTRGWKQQSSRKQSLEPITFLPANPPQKSVKWEDCSEIHKILMLGHMTKNSWGLTNATMSMNIHSLSVCQEQQYTKLQPRQTNTMTYKPGYIPTKLHPTQQTPLRAAASVLPLSQRWRVIVHCVQERYLKPCARDKQSHKYHTCIIMSHHNWSRSTFQ